MEYRLLIDLEVVAVLDSLSQNKRRAILEHFAKARSSPDRYADYQEQDSSGRRVEISVSPVMRFVIGSILPTGTSKF